MADIIEIRVPRENVNDETVILIKWHVTSGQAVEESQVVAEIETSKTVFEIYSPSKGYVHFTIAAGTEVAVGAMLCQITDSNLPPADAEPSGPVVINTESVSSQAMKTAAANGATLVLASEDATPASVRLSTAAQRLAKEHGVDLNKLTGRGLVRERDVLALLECRQATSTPEPARPSPALPRETKPHLVPYVKVQHEALPRRKMREIKALEAGLHGSLPSAVTIACSTHGLRKAVATRADLNGNATSIILCEVARLLRKFPVFNGCYQDRSMAFYDEVNVGFAVDAGLGLKVPVIHHADTKSLPAIAAEMQEAIFQYLEDQLPVETLSRGTFTITDLSGEDVLAFQPLITEGQSAILGVGGEHFVGNASVGTFQLILVFDHRCSDGRTAGQFLRCLRDRLQSHESSMLGHHAVSNDSVPIGELRLPRICSRCGRSASEVEELRGYLIASVVPAGSICSVCLSGY